MSTGIQGGLSNANGRAGADRNLSTSANQSSNLAIFAYLTAVSGDVLSTR